MTALGVLAVTHEGAFGESRRKILTLAEALGFDAIASTRLATMFSELARAGLAAGGGVTVEASLTHRDTRPCLALTFAFTDKLDPPASAGRFFDSVRRVVSPGGAPRLETFKFLPDYEFQASSSFIEVQRQMLARASREELLYDLQAKNDMLQSLSSKLSKYLSPQVYKSIFAGDKDVALSTERKKLTVFFSDIKNFTLTTDDLQPEDLTFLLNSYFTEMSAIALSHGATIDKFIGDAMLMFFGDPETKGVEEDAKACVRMAVAMQRKMDELARKWRDRGLTRPLKMRIGINTGYCNVGNFGSQDRMDYTIIGGEVNLAARLEANADPGGILMSYETFALTKDIVAAEERAPLTVKGIRREVRNFAVTGEPGGEGGLGGEGQALRLDLEGLSVSVNPAGLDAAALEAAAAELEALIARLAEPVPD